MEPGLQGRPLGPDGMQGRGGTLRVFLHYLHRQRILPTDLSRAVPRRTGVLVGDAAARHHLGRGRARAGRGGSPDARGETRLRHLVVTGDLRTPRPRGRVVAPRRHRLASRADARDGSEEWALNDLSAGDYRRSRPRGLLEGWTAVGGRSADLPQGARAVYALAVFGDRDACPVITCTSPVSPRHGRAPTRFATPASSVWSPRTCRSRSSAITWGIAAADSTQVYGKVAVHLSRQLALGDGEEAL